MKKIILCLFAWPISLAVVGQDPISQKSDEVLTTYCKLNRFNGSALVAVGGKIVLQKGYGFKNVQQKTLNDEHTIFMIGSITKEFTAAVILMLAEQKKLSLNDKVSKYFPGFVKGDSITLKNLLTHTSGIFNYTELGDIWALSARPTNEQNVLDSIQKRPLLFSPGEKFSYSNSNYMLLAYIIQKVTHQPYEAVVRHWLFKPLGMLHSGFDFQGLHDPEKSTGYWHFSAAKTTEGPVLDSSEYIGSGNMYSTVTDLLKWHQALQSGKFISKQLQQEAYLPFKGPYGFGWELDSVAGKKIIGHNGRMFGFESKMMRIPEDDVFVILLNNHSGQPSLGTIGQTLISILYQQPYTLPQRPIVIDEVTLKDYTGFYEDEEHRTFEIQLLNGHLFVMASPENQIELFPLKNNQCMFMEHEAGEGIMEFIMDEQGKVKKVSFHTPRGVKTATKKTT